MSFTPKPFGKGNPCPICDRQDGSCRYNPLEPDFVLCHTYADAHKKEVINGYICVKESNGHTASFKPDNNDKWTSERKREWIELNTSRQQKAQIEKQRQRQRALSPAERHKLYSQILGQLTLDSKTLADLQKRGFTQDEIDNCTFKSVEAGQKLVGQFDRRLPGIASDGRSLAVKHDGYLCPVYDLQGQIVALQLRLHNPPDGNRYRWLSTPITATLKLYPEGENPLSVLRPMGKPEGIALVEGVGAKLFLASRRLSLLVIGAAGGHWASSPQLFKQWLELLYQEIGGHREITIYPDAGDILNEQVTTRWIKVSDLLISWGWSVKFAWWGQTTKGLHRDIDELSDFGDIKYLSKDEFHLLTSVKAGARHESIQKPVDDEEEAQYYSNLAQKEEEFDQHCGYSDAKNEEECKTAFFETYPERVKRQQDSLRSLATWNPIIQDTKFVSLMIDEFFPTKETPALEVPGTTRSLTDLLPGIYGLTVGMGGGKSTLMKLVVKEFKSGNVLTFSNAVIDQFCHDEEIAEHIAYIWDLEKDDERSHEKKKLDWVRAREGWMAACVESIFKCPPKDVLILEEVENIIQSLLTSSTCKRGRRARIREFIRHLKKAKYVFCCDADLSRTTLKLLQAYAPDKKIRVVENITKRFEWECIFYTGVKEILDNGQQKEYPNRRDNFELALLASVARNKKSLICTDSQRWGQSIERAILMVNPAAKILRVDSITKTDELTRDTVEKFLKNPNKWIKENQPDYIIYSPTCKASVDITIEDHFDAVFGCFLHLSHLSAKQQLGRLRTNAPRIIFAKTHAISDDEGSNSPLPSVLAKHMFNHNFETLREIVLAEHPEIKDDFDLVLKLGEIMDFESGEYKDPSVQALVELKAQENYSRANLRNLLAQELERCGHIVKMMEPGEKSSHCTTPHRKEILMEWSLAISSAEVIDLTQATAIQQSMNATLEDRHKATKAILQHRLPDFNLTSSFLYDYYLTDRNWISSQETRYLLEHPEMARTFDQNTWFHALKNDTAWWDVRTSSLKIKALTLLNIQEIAKSGKEWHHQTEWLLDFKKHALNNAKFVKLALGITVTKDSDPCYLLRRCLERAGYPVKGSQRRISSPRVGDQRIRVYYVDPDVSMPGLYSETYAAISKRFSEKLASLDRVTSRAHPSPIDISYRKGCDSQEEIKEIVSSLVKPVVPEEEVPGGVGTPSIGELIGELESIFDLERLEGLQAKYSSDLIDKAIDYLPLVPYRRICEMLGRSPQIIYQDVS